LSYLGEPEDLVRQLSWFSMDGKVGARVAEPREWIEGVAISPDGRRILASAGDGLWAYDVETGARSRITTGQTDITPDWVDADTIVFVRTQGSHPVVVIKELTGGREETVLAEHARFPRVTADGRRVMFNTLMTSRPGWEVAWIDLDRPSEIRRLGPAHAGARFPSVSPDGSLVAYISGEVGRDEVFLTRLPTGEGKWQLSTAGGGWTLFSPRGHEVFYRAPGGTLMAVPIAAANDEVQIGQPRKLFDWGAGWMLYYDIARDGQRGVAAVPVGNAVSVSSVSVVQHWHREFVNR
jgi:Tol biopolymer transport system component